ncbi:diacylglycerol kinase [Imtechella halotolerans]|uniref:Diacylglycerol kinase n=1 Tax=Imtechella halotolerans K1 TaxID=946077 RepID=I0WCC1_9FLAO|nr:diacylglycerol kinase family protein [Imtechella halotolerans]EID74037.1 diacylglycerol kinase [Imtechella halotolerans K1]WMQ64568.1 diacylglycerol kinase family protein [Imtechella halotolerans]
MRYFLNSRRKAVGYACKGAYLLLKTESSVQIQSLIALATVLAGWYFEISALEWIVQLLTISLVMSIEGLNTAVEKIADFMHPDYHHKIGVIKDISAGAVFISAIMAIVIGCIIYLPKIF